MSGVRAQVMAPTTQRTLVVGSASTAQSRTVRSRSIDYAVTSREITKRDDTGRVRRLTPSWRWRWPGGDDGGAGPLAGSAGRTQRTG